MPYVPKICLLELAFPVPCSPFPVPSWSYTPLPFLPSVWTPVPFQDGLNAERPWHGSKQCLEKSVIMDGFTKVACLCDISKHAVHSRGSIRHYKSLYLTRFIGAFRRKCPILIELCSKTTNIGVLAGRGKRRHSGMMPFRGPFRAMTERKTAHPGPSAGTALITERTIPWHGPLTLPCHVKCRAFTELHARTNYRHRQLRHSCVERICFLG